MVDPEGAGVAHVAGEQIGHDGIAVLAHAVGIVGRQAPDLPLGGDRIGRGADPYPVGQQGVVRPGLGPVGRCAHGQIAAEPDGETRGPARRLGQLLRAKPLDVHVETDAVGVGHHQAPDAVAVGASNVLRPVSPGRSGPRFGDGLEGCKVLERPALRRHEGVEPGIARKGGVAAMQGFGLGGPDARIVDHSGRFAAWTGVREVEIEGIQEPSIRGIIGARPIAPVVEQGVQRIDGEHGRPLPGRRLAERAEGCEVAHALIAGPCDGVELRGDAEAAAPAL